MWELRAAPTARRWVFSVLQTDSMDGPLWSLQCLHWRLYGLCAVLDNCDEGLW